MYICERWQIHDIAKDNKDMIESFKHRKLGNL